MKISIIIPAFHESHAINGIIRHLRAIGVKEDIEIIVVDGAVEQDTLSRIEYASSDIILLASEKGRGIQMNKGAAAASGDILLFLHADTMLPENAFEKIRNAVARGCNAGAFKLRLNSSALFLKLVAYTASLRSQMTGTVFGDQGIFLRKDYFEKLGGYRNIVLMEDAELIKRIKGSGEKICIINNYVLSSARRWQRDGYLYTTLRNQLIRLLFALGVSPRSLERLYESGKQRNKEIQ